MNLIDNLRLTFPNSNANALQQINLALNTAINIHIVPAFVPAGFSATALSVGNITPIMTEVFIDLGIKLTPILSSALSAQANPTTSTPILAWNLVKSSILALPATSNLRGESGVVFWNAILKTVFDTIPGIPAV